MKFLISIILLLVLSFSAFGQNAKMTAEEIVKKHLASIGAPDDLASVKSIVAVGKVKPTFKYTPLITSGVAQLGSEGNKVLLAMVFDHISYPYEKAGYDGKDFNIAILPEGKRTVLGNFLTSHSSIFKEGLIGGSLSTAWSLLNLSSRQPKLSFAGTEKINNRQAYKLKYSPRKGGSDLQINLFFDAETFRHVMTEYQFIASARSVVGEIGSSRESDSRYRLVEEFSDFKTEGKLTLPHTYKINYTAFTNTTLEQDWEINFSQFIFNQTIGDKAFDVSSSRTE